MLKGLICNYALLINVLLGTLQLNIIRIWKQLEYFEQYKVRLTDVIGPDQTRQVVNKGMILISLGGNDFVNNYYLIPFSARSREYSLPDYVRYLVSEYRKVLSVILVLLLNYMYTY